jgi:hypothetical protein
MDRSPASTEMHFLKFAILTVVAVAGVCALVLAGMAALFSSAFDDMCGNEILADIPSPNGALRAVVFERDCGATTDFSTQVTILPVDAKLPDEGGSVFVADTNHGAAPSGEGGGPEVKVQWRSASQLSIAHHTEARVFLARQRVEKVDVSYVLK